MLDKEWVDLILEAKSMGLTINEIRAFFETKVLSAPVELFQ
ncbi:DNA-binding anti-repressor SinI [Alicyclobacillaceae bacterium I2511]|nr:DNA-binding anti-repressor SinI [Alicyclobacillaceae bacterium I2511]